MNLKLMAVGLIAISIDARAQNSSLKLVDLGSAYYGGAATAISANGQWVCGVSSVTNNLGAAHSFLYRIAERSLEIFTVPSSYQTTAKSVSNDGMLGGSVDINSFIRSSSGSLATLDNPAGMNYLVDLKIAQSSGSAVLTYNQPVIGHQFYRWTPNHGLVALGHLPGYTSGVVAAIGYDGTIAGTFDRAGARTSFQWRESSGFLETGAFGENSHALIEAISEDGSKMLGYDGEADGKHPYMWTPAAGWRRFGHIFGQSTELTCMNAGGSVYGGWYDSNRDDEPDKAGFVRNGQTYDLKAYLLSHGVSMPSNYYFEKITGVSGDGNTFVGTVFTGSGNSYGFVATVPEPSTFVGLGMLLAGTLFRRRRRKR